MDLKSFAGPVMPVFLMTIVVVMALACNSQDLDGEPFQMNVGAKEPLWTTTDEFLDLVEARLDAYERQKIEELPLWFKEELIDPAPLGPCDIALWEGESVVKKQDDRKENGTSEGDGAAIAYFTSNINARQLIREIVNQMERKGWSGLCQEDLLMATMTKKEGNCQWALISCTSLDDTSSVMFQIQRAPRGISNEEE